MTPARSAFVTLVLTVGMFLTGCSAAADDPGLVPVAPPTVTVYEYAKAKGGYRLPPVEVRIPERPAGQPRFTSNAVRAVAALLDHTPTSRNRYNAWNGECAPAEQVAQVKITEKEISVRLDGWNETKCDVDEEEVAARDQQIAWTIIVNSKADLPRPPFPPVVVHEGARKTWPPITADGAYLPPDDHY